MYRIRKNYRNKLFVFKKSLRTLKSRELPCFETSKPFEVSRRLNDRREGKVACSRIISSQREEITPRCFLVTRKRATCHEPRESPASYPRRFAAAAAAADLAPALFVPLARRQLKINPPRSSSLFFLLRLRFVLPPFFFSLSQSIVRIIRVTVFRFRLNNILRGGKVQCEISHEMRFCKVE